jgi:restriction system protein
LTRDRESGPQGGWLDTMAGLPWWACVVPAVLSYLVLHALASRPQAIVVDEGAVVLLMTGHLLAAAVWNSLELLVPALCLSALLAQALRIPHELEMDGPCGADAAPGMSTWEFERLASGGLRARRLRGKSVAAIRR